MGCPHLREVVMVYCDAWPVKKLVPRAQLVAAGHCIHDDPSCCPVLLAQTSATRPASAAADVSSPAAPQPKKETPS